MPHLVVPMLYLNDKMPHLNTGMSNPHVPIRHLYIRIRYPDVHWSNPHIYFRHLFVELRQGLLFSSLFEKMLIETKADNN